MAEKMEHEFKDVILKATDISLVLGGRQILKNVDAEIRNVTRPGKTQGQVVGFLGPSGIGKTQLFRILSGLQSPTTGSVTVTDKNIPVQKGMVGVVAQNYPLFDHRNVLENLTVATTQSGKSSEVGLQKAAELLDRFKLRDQAYHYPKQLSGGQKQRVAIAQQLLCSDHFLLMDEPFSGLDPLMVREVTDLIIEVAAMDDLNTIIVVTHDIRSAVAVSDTLWLMGRDRDEKGAPIQGSRIMETFNLIDLGLAWRKDIANEPEFDQFVHKIEKKFEVL